jgi:hypothetical protein
LFFITNTAFADEKSHRQLAEEFILLTGVEQLMDKSFSKVREQQIQQIDIDYQDEKPEDSEALKERVGNYLDGQLRFARVKNDFVKIYMDFFTEEELASIVEFYKSPAIKKLKESDRDIKLKLMKATQDKMINLNADIMRINNEYKEEMAEKETEGK